MQFIDNPGFDEFSTHVTEVAHSGLSISSAILYVTTHGQHRQMQTSGFFRSMFQNNRGMYNCFVVGDVRWMLKRGGGGSSYPHLSYSTRILS